MANEIGRPATTEEQFQKWLDDMAPFLKLGETLNAAMEDTDLISHEFTIRGKYKVGDWFSRKVDAYRAMPGKLANNVIVKIIMQVNDKIKQQLPVSEDEMKNVRFYAEKSRSAQPYFVNRNEVAIGKSVDEVLNELESENQDDVAEEITKQMVEANAPLQNQDQAGGDNSVQSQPDAANPPA